MKGKKIKGPSLPSMYLVFLLSRLILLNTQDIAINRIFYYLCLQGSPLLTEYLRSSFLVAASKDIRRRIWLIV